MISPFAYLQEIEKRCHAHAVGLPTQQTVIDDWVGIGFSSNALNCVARMSEVTEILPVPDTIRVPGVKSWVKGLANIRGALMPILDLRGFVTGENTLVNPKCRILIINQAGVLAGLLVEEVFGLRRFKQELIQKTISGDVKEARMSAYITGGFSEESRYWNIFSMQSLVSTNKFLRVV